MAVEAFVRAVRLLPPAEGERHAGYPWELPAIKALADGLDLHPKVTYLIGENGSGKSTLLEAVAVAAGMNAEGGSSNFAFSTRDSHSQLWRSIRLVRGTRRPRTDFFLRAESLFTAATYLERLPRGGGDPLAAYGGASLHEQSHGESFLAVMLNRFGRDGLYLLDEPEAALSTQNCLTCLRRIHELVEDGSQFIVATHSPIVLAYPHAHLQLRGGRAEADVIRRGRPGAPHAELPGGPRALPGSPALRLTRPGGASGGTLRLHADPTHEAGGAANGALG